MRDSDYSKYIYILYEVSPGICADAILYGEQSRGECIILLAAYNNIIHGVVPQTLPLCCRAAAGRGGAIHHITRPCVYAQARTRFRPDECAPFYAAAFSLSIPPDPPHNDAQHSAREINRRYHPRERNTHGQRRGH